MNLRNIFKHNSWIGWGIGFLGIVISIYVGVIFEKKPYLEIQIKTNSTIIDTEEDIPKFDVILNQNSILEDSLNISIVILRFENKGNEHILPSSYDPNKPFSITIKNGNIISQPELFDTNSKNNYLLESIDGFSNNNIVFKNSIFEKDNYLHLKVLVLHKQGIEPTIGYDGIIGGTDIVFTKEMKTNTIIIGKLQAIALSILVVVWAIIIVLTYYSYRLKVQSLNNKISLTRVLERVDDLDKNIQGYEENLRKEFLRNVENKNIEF